MPSYTLNFSLLKTFLKKIIADKRKNTYIIIFILLVLFNILVFHNYSFYNKCIVKIQKAETSLVSSDDNYSDGIVSVYDQTLYGSVMNTGEKGKEIILNNEYSSNGIFNDAYSKGDEVFVTLSDNSEIIGNKSYLTGTVSSLKRDKYVALIFSIFAMMLVLLEKKRGILTVLSLFINIGAFYFCLELYGSGYDILLLCIGLSLFFIIFSIVFVNGNNKQSFSSIISTILSLALTMGLFMLVLHFSGEMDYSYMDFLIMPADAGKIFLSELLIGGLGTIMDIAITMSSAVKELVYKDNTISIKSLFLSGRKIAEDIMGAMINVLLFTYICGGIPMILYLLKNDIQIYSIISVYMPYEIDRFLIGGIGILLSIPISLVVSILIIKGGQKSCK